MKHSQKRDHPPNGKTRKVVLPGFVEALDSGEETKESKLFTLDLDRPSHGRTLSELCGTRGPRVAH
jgi:hypothetical protein